jgi:hypothetical protein
VQQLTRKALRVSVSAVVRSRLRVRQSAVRLVSSVLRLASKAKMALLQASAFLVMTVSLVTRASLVVRVTSLVTAAVTSLSVSTMQTSRQKASRSLLRVRLASLVARPTTRSAIQVSFVSQTEPLVSVAALVALTLTAQRARLASTTAMLLTA